MGKPSLFKNYLEMDDLLGRFHHHFKEFTQPIFSNKCIFSPGILHVEAG